MLRTPPHLGDICDVGTSAMWGHALGEGRCLRMVTTPQALGTPRGPGRVSPALWGHNSSQPGDTSRMWGDTGTGHAFLPSHSPLRQPPVHHGPSSRLKPHKSNIIAAFSHPQHSFSITNEGDFPGLGGRSPLGDPPGTPKSSSFAAFEHKHPQGGSLT